MMFACLADTSSELMRQLGSSLWKEVYSTHELK